MDAFETMQIVSGHSSHDHDELAASKWHGRIKRLVGLFVSLFFVWGVLNIWVSCVSGHGHAGIQLLQDSTRALNHALMHSIVVALIWWASAQANYTLMFAAANAAAVLCLQSMNVMYAFVHEAWHESAAELRDDMTLRDRLCRDPASLPPQPGGLVDPYRQSLCTMTTLTGGAVVAFWLLDIGVTLIALQRMAEIGRRVGRSVSPATRSLKLLMVVHFGTLAALLIMTLSTLAVITSRSSSRSDYIFLAEHTVLLPLSMGASALGVLRQSTLQWGALLVFAGLTCISHWASLVYHVRYLTLPGTMGRPHCHEPGTACTAMRLRVFAFFVITLAQSVFVTISLQMFRRVLDTRVRNAVGDRDHLQRYARVRVHDGAGSSGDGVHGDEDDRFELGPM